MIKVPSCLLRNVINVYVLLFRVSKALEAEFSWYYNPAWGRIEIEPSYWDLHGVSSRIMWPRSLTSGYSKRPCKGYFRAYLSRLQMLFCRSAFIVHNQNK